MILLNSDILKCTDFLLNLALGQVKAVHLEKHSDLSRPLTWKLTIYINKYVKYIHSIQKPARQVVHVRGWNEVVLFHFYGYVSGPWCPPKQLCELGLLWNCLLIFGSPFSFFSSPFCTSKRDPRVAETGCALLHFLTAGYFPPYTSSGCCSKTRPTRAPIAWNCNPVMALGK